MEFRLAGDDVERAPGEQAGDRIEIGGIHVAAEFGGGEGNGAHAGKRVAHPQVPPEAALRDFRNPLLQRACTGAAIGVDLRPALRRRAVDFLDALAIPALHGVIEGVENALFQSRAAVGFLIGHARPPADFLNVRPEQIEVRRARLLVADFHEARPRRLGGDFLEAVQPPLPHARAVEAHQLEEDFQILRPLRGIVGCLEQGGEHDGAGEHDGLGAPPFPQRVQDFPGAGVALQITLQRELADGELDFEQGFSLGSGHGKIIL